ncbi:sugar phosphate isomerase/epimerase family protein [Peribacillus sp. SCS-155]|uniref:sugar phosphate isomerase/epimerase family protein n=1 Tax=Peribacillus sedimenti TaxID=3115297 RepID=UPI003905CEFC
MFKFSATQWIFGNESLETSFTRLKKFGYDGVELAGEPEEIDVKMVLELMEKYGLSCTSICGIYNAERDLSSSNPEIREAAVTYVKDCIDFAALLGATHLIVVPSAVGKQGPLTTAEEEWNNSVKSVREAGEYALSKNISLAIESLNRYETYLVNNFDTALKFIQEVSVPSVKIMADLFHMNIEERNNREALLKVAPYLIHVHIADNTREAAGLGKTDFSEVIDTLKEIDYKGPITMEFLPPVSNPYLVAQNSESADIYDEFTEQSIVHIKQFI